MHRLRPSSRITASLLSNEWQTHLLPQQLLSPLVKHGAEQLPVCIASNRGGDELRFSAWLIKKIIIVKRISTSRTGRIKEWAACQRIYSPVFSFSSLWSVNSGNAPTKTPISCCICISINCTSGDNRANLEICKA